MSQDELLEGGDGSSDIELHPPATPRAIGAESQQDTPGPASPGPDESPSSQASPSCGLLDHYENPEDITALHPKRLLVTVLSYLFEKVALPGPKRRRAGKVCGLRHVLASLLTDSSIDEVSLDHQYRHSARHLYRRVACVVTQLSIRGLQSENRCQWKAADTDLRNRWAILARCYKDYSDIRHALDTGLGRRPASQPSAAGADPGTDGSGGGAATVECVKGYGFLLTFNLSAGEGVPEVIHLINRNLSQEALCREYAKLDCYLQVFNDAVRWALRLGNELTMPLVNVSMEQSDKSKDPWRVHVHVLVGLNPSGVGGLGRAVLRNVPKHRFRWEQRQPNIQAVDPFKATTKMIVSSLNTLSYYVVGPKIGQILREATLWPITDP